MRVAGMAMLGVLWLAAAGLAQPVQLRVAVDRSEVAVGESVRVDVELKWEGPQDAYTIDEWVAPERSGTALIASSDQMATAQEGGKAVFRRVASYLARADEAGTVTLSPAKVVLKGRAGKQEYRSQVLGFVVNPAQSGVPLEGVLGVVAVGLAAVAVAAARRARPAPTVVKSRGDRARERAEALRRVGHRDHREFFGAVLEALKDGLAEDAPAVARERDRGKLLAGLEGAGIAAARRQAAGELMTLCDEARFNPEAPGAEVRERALGLLVTALS